MLATMIWGVLLTVGALALLLPPMLLVLLSIRARLGHRARYHDPAPSALPPRPFVPMVLAANVRSRQIVDGKLAEAEPAREVRRAA